MYHLFEKFGIELEYMIVDKSTLKVLPVTDKLIEKAWDLLKMRSR